MQEDTATQTEINKEASAAGEEPECGTKQQPLLCDRCGFEMFETNCKVICPNCGSRYDCSDLTIYFD